MTLRAFGAFDGTLPIPTGMVIGFLKDPRTAPHLRYCQFIPAPEIQYMYFKLDPDEPVRLQELNDYAWAYDDFSPTGRGFTAKGDWKNNTTQRWAFPYELGEATMRVWAKSGVDTKMLYDRIRGNHAALHRSVRILAGLTGASWPAFNTSDLNTLLGTAGAYFNKSSGVQYLPDGTENPNFQIIKKAMQIIKRRIHLSTNGAVNGEELICVIPPIVAAAMSTAGEIVDFLKQSQFAKELTDPNVRDWSIPSQYAGFTWVVEDTPRCFINQHDDGTVADVSVPAQKDYILNTPSVYVVSRAGGLDGHYGFRNFSTLQLFHFNGEARVEAKSDPWNELVKSRIVMEDRVETPALLSGFQLTNVLSP